MGCRREDDELVSAKSMILSLGLMVSLEMGGFVGVLGFANLEAVAMAVLALVGEPVGVVCRNGDGEAGEPGRRNGELRVGGEP